MRLIRSWPANIPANRAYVVDELERFVMKGYDYRVLDQIDDDVLLLEWDVAVERVDLDRFVGQIDPERCLVAPYRIYQSLAGREYPCHPLWAHRRYEANETQTRFVTPDDPTCHMFGFGMVYLPRQFVKRFCEEWDGFFDDAGFSGWHYKNADEPEVRITWDVHPVHLHFRHRDYARLG